ncbi:MAG TPA: hypothetical protein VFU60_18090 [Ktedonobacterales bacterium]|nr:hypothetical protein [Ktedonobacterales bacterium]
MFAVGGGGRGASGSVPRGPDLLPQARLLARIRPVAPIDIQIRGNLTAALFDQAVMLAPRHCWATLAVTYEVAPIHLERPDRMRVFLRWGIGFDPDAQEADMLAKRASKHIHQAYAEASQMLCQYYQLDPLASGELDTRLQAELAEQRVVELPYKRWSANTDWLAPMQLQPTLDLLLRQPRFAAIQCSIQMCSANASHAGSAGGEGQEQSEEYEERERPASLGAESGGRAGSAQRYQAQVVALGAAVHHDALRRLAEELCGYGVLVTPRADRPKPPGVRAVPPRDKGDQQRIARNLLGPAAEASNPAARVTYTRDEAVTLFPLPFQAD